MRLDVAFMQRDRRFAAVKYYPHAPAKGFTHDNAGVYFHPGATSLTQLREANSHAGFQFRVVVVHSAPDMMRREQATSLPLPKDRGQYCCGIPLAFRHNSVVLWQHFRGAIHGAMNS